MPRRPRHYLPNMPYHIVQRGNNREACFIEPEGYQLYLDLWRVLSTKYNVSVHAYCLMTNHVHFLVTPADSEGVSLLMKQVGSRYAQYINKKYKRTGTLWEGRHKSSLVQSERYLLVCSRYIELNPVRAAMVVQPDEYKWTSYRVNAWGDVGWLQPHAEYLRLGNSVEERCCNYRELFRYQLDEKIIQQLRQSIHYCQPYGDNHFAKYISERYGIKPGQMVRGRPKNKS